MRVLTFVGATLKVRANRTRPRNTSRLAAEMDECLWTYVQFLAEWDSETSGIP
jgi:hypothetical protein